MPGVRVTRGGRGRGRVLPQRGALQPTPQVRVVLDFLLSFHLLHAVDWFQPVVGDTVVRVEYNQQQDLG